MREILFRGKRKDNGAWIYGDLRQYNEKSFGIYSKETHTTMKVDPETVGQYTGLTDKNGVKIFEGDIIKTWDGFVGKIEFGQFWDDESKFDFYGYAWVESNSKHVIHLENYWNGHKVIGNIHDNPEPVEE